MTKDFVLDWNAIRPLNGSRAEGFEELCAQLARVESPMGSRFVRKGTPDGGVECYAILNDNTEWGWQAKYIDGLGDSQWSQIDDSIKTALEKHPKLVRYYVCVPVNRPDARVDGKKSAMDRWDDHVKRWTGWAATHGMSVEFVYWGSHELLERLSKSEHIGRVRFWFNVRGFDKAWFSARLDEALKSAGPRYSAELHVDLPIATEFEAFGRTVQFFDRVKAHARPLRQEFLSFHRAGTNEPAPGLSDATAAFETSVQTILKDLAQVAPQSIGVLPFARIATTVAESESAGAQLERLLFERDREQDKASPKEDGGVVHGRRGNNHFRDRRHSLYALLSEIRQTYKAVLHASKIAGNTIMLLTGAAGMGKTHLLCDVARQRIDAGRPTVLLMGQRFVGTDSPWSQALQQVDLSGLSAEEFTGALEAAAQAADCRALLIIDAINEGAGRNIWPSHLAAFIAQIERSPWIAVALSVRTSYEQAIVPDEVKARSVTVVHEGFAGHEYDATHAFFVHYGLELLADVPVRRILNQRRGRIGAS